MKEKKVTLNQKQVQEIIEKEGKFHKEYTNILKKSGSDDLIYELTSNRFLLVFYPESPYIGGKGDIYSKEYFLKWIENLQNRKNSKVYLGGNSIANWGIHTKRRKTFTNDIDKLIRDLAFTLKIDLEALDKSYKSLNLVSEKVEQYGIENSISDIYDGLVAYLGEVLRAKLDGTWKMDKANGSYPYIELNKYHCMPINVVWREFLRIDKVDFRKAIISEVKTAKLKSH